jgi:hypothetical protein
LEIEKPMFDENHFAFTDDAGRPLVHVRAVASRRHLASGPPDPPPSAPAAPAPSKAPSGGGGDIRIPEDMVPWARDAEEAVFQAWCKTMGWDPAKAAAVAGRTTQASARHRASASLAGAVGAIEAAAKDRNATEEARGAMRTVLANYATAAPTADLRTAAAAAGRRVDADLELARAMGLPIRAPSSGMSAARASELQRAARAR